MSLGSELLCKKPLNAAQLATTRDGGPHFLFSAIAIGVFLGYAVSLANLLAGHQWILVSGGKPVPCDFLAYWVAGRMALSGHAAAAYDANALHAAQAIAAGSFPDYLYWNYPPFFFFVAVLLASTPYLAAFLGWVISTSLAYALAIGTIARRWEGVLAACASPVILLTAFGGQNGFLSAALLGGFLLFLPDRPIVSGVLLGLMTYKPQLGILFPVVLIAGGYWRALYSAAATAALLIGASALVFGTDTYVSFVHSLAMVSHSSLTLGGEGWAKMQSFYSIARVMGAGDPSAWIIQILAILGGAVVMLFLWRSDLPYELKAAGAAAASMLATPYLHAYDFPLLLVAFAFLYRHRSFDRIDWIGALTANLLTLAFLAQIAPLGSGLVAIVCVLTLRRIVRSPGISRAAMLRAPP